MGLILNGAESFFLPGGPHEVYEAGMELQGTEVKSLRAGKANLKDSYAEIKNGEIFVQNMHISPYEQGNIFNHASFC